MKIFNKGTVFRLALIYLAFAILVAVIQRQLIYFPMRDAGMNARAAEVGWQPWRNPSGELIGWKTDSSDQAASGPVVLMMHGNAGSATWRWPWSALLRGAGFADVRVLEYPGYGDRPGQPAEDTLIAAAVEAVRLWSAERDGAPVYLLGESLGTGVASGVYERAPQLVAGLLLLVPFDSIRAVGQARVPFLPVGWIMRDHFDSARRLAGVDVPTVIVAAADDEVVPVRHARALRDAIRDKSRCLYIELEGTLHNDLPDVPESWLPRAVEFLTGKSGQTLSSAR